MKLTTPTKTNCHVRTKPNLVTNSHVRTEPPKQESKEISTDR